MSEQQPPPPPDDPPPPPPPPPDGRTHYQISRRMRGPVPGCPLTTCEDRRAPREAVYLLMWQSYRDGCRTVRGLKKAHKIHGTVAHKAIEHGWPDKGWPSFKSRLEMWEARKDQARAAEIARADAAEATKRGRAQANEWKRFAPRAVALANEGHEVLTQLAARLKDAVKAATFVRYRRVRLLNPATGKVEIVDQPYVDGMTVANAARVWAAAFKDTGTMMSLLTGGPTARTEITAPKFTPEQIAEIEEGRLPEGVTMEMVAQAVLAAADDEQKTGGETG